MIDPSHNFDIDNINVGILYKLYPDRLSDELKAQIMVLPENKLSALQCRIKLSSALIIYHPEFDKYNELFQNLTHKLKSDNRVVNAVVQKQYNEDIRKLSSRISEDFMQAFEEAVFVNKNVEKALKPHIKTLFFICISFYNLYWDTFGESFNGPIVDYTINELLPKAWPHQYRAVQQIHFVSNLLYDYFKKPHAQKKVIIEAGGRSHITDDDVLIGWLINLITEGSLPASMDYIGKPLSKLLKNRHSMEIDEFLLQLNQFTQLKANDLVDVKRKVVRDYCLDIHKIFSHYLGLPTDTYSGKRIRIYHNILKAFHMDDFSVLHRLPTRSNPRIDEAENRLGELLRRQ